MYQMQTSKKYAIACTKYHSNAFCAERIRMDSYVGLRTLDKIYRTLIIITCIAM